MLPMKAKIEGMGPQIKEVQGLPATMELGARYGTNSPSEPPEETNFADTSVPDFWSPEF